MSAMFTFGILTVILGIALGMVAIRRRKNAAMFTALFEAFKVCVIVGFVMLGAGMMQMMLGGAVAASSGGGH
jgi:hypothetical protein